MFLRVPVILFWWGVGRIISMVWGIRSMVWGGLSTWTGRGQVHGPEGVQVQGEPLPPPG